MVLDVGQQCDHPFRQQPPTCPFTTTAVHRRHCLRRRQATPVSRATLSTPARPHLPPICQCLRFIELGTDSTPVIADPPTIDANDAASREALVPQSSQSSICFCIMSVMSYRLKHTLPSGLRSSSHSESPFLFSFRFRRFPHAAAEHVSYGIVVLDTQPQKCSCRRFLVHSELRRSSSLRCAAAAANEAQPRGRDRTRPGTLTRRESQLISRCR